MVIILHIFGLHKISEQEEGKEIDNPDESEADSITLRRGQFYISSVSYFSLAFSQCFVISNSTYS